MFRLYIRVINYTIFQIIGQTVKHNGTIIVFIPHDYHKQVLNYMWTFKMKMKSSPSCHLT